MEPAAVLRLKQRQEFLRVAASGHKWAAPGLILQARRYGETDTANVRKDALGDGFRIGYTVSRKVGGAVERNRAKRRLRAAAHKVMPGHARSGHDFVLIGRRATLKRTFPALVGDLETALRKLDAYDEENGLQARDAEVMGTT
ncbi:MAG: ribonuclease P protein component [Rhodospirillales bacterium]|nr:ribonuclease P protein component [Alphaproteobacteria bacterium]MBL6948676.1 ribonuclease P protein component [Rhodospirillales bacterium]